MQAAKLLFSCILESTVKSNKVFPSNYQKNEQVSYL